jgi:D-lactate dehydrogenase
MKIVCCEIEEWEAEKLYSLGLAKDTVMTQDRLTTANVGEFVDAEVISCFIYSDLSAATLEKMPQLKLIATRSTGTDHIDLNYCSQHGITVTNVPTYGEHTVAEHVFALLLALSRHIPEAIQRTREGNFSFKSLCGFDLFGKTIGIIGTGAIGSHVARIAQGFGMKILGYDIHPESNPIISHVEFDTLLAESDIISLNVPNTPQTLHLLGPKEFKSMKDGVVIINTARGAVIDVKALLSALQSGKVSAAGLDVLPEEPAIREEAEILRDSFAEKHNLETLLVDYALLRQENVIITPHSAFFTNEAVSRILSTTANNVLSFIAGHTTNEININSFQSKG